MQTTYKTKNADVNNFLASLVSRDFRFEACDANGIENRQGVALKQTRFGNTEFMIQVQHMAGRVYAALFARTSQNPQFTLLREVGTIADMQNLLTLIDKNCS